MFYLPLFHDLKGSPCLVVGAGDVALRKVRWLIKAQAAITVVAPACHEEIRQEARDGTLIWLEQTFAEPQLDGMRLVIGAADDASINEQIFTLATQRGILVNCVDDPERCNVIFPSIIDRSPMYVAVSSSATAPALARIVRGWIEAVLPRNLGELSRFSRKFRDKVRTHFSRIEDRVRFWNRLLTQETASLLMQGEYDQAE